MPTRSLKAAFLAGLLATAGTSHAFAIEAEEVGDRMTALLARQQIEFAYDGARMEGDDVVLEGVTVREPDGDDSYPLGDLTLQDVSELEDDTFRVDTIAIEQFTHEDDDVTISGNGLTVTGLLLPSDTADAPFGGAMRYDRMALAQLSVEDEDGPVFAMTDAYTTLVQEDGALRAEGVVDSFTVHLGTALDSANAATVVEDLGYGEITGSARFDALWNPSDGRLTLTDYETTVEDAGTLSITTDISGYTPEFIRTMDEMAAQSAESDQESAAQGMAVLGMMQQLSFHGATIRFTDDTLTEKVLDYMAEQQGSTPADIIAQARSLIPRQTAPFLGEEMAGNVAEAVGTFLENPENLEISANPESPVPFAMLAGAAMGAPEMLVEQIGLTVQANQ